MGNRKSTSFSSRRNNSINALIGKSRAKESQQVKLLLLGTGESGKSTIFKQMRMLYGQGISDQSRKQVAPDLIANLIEGAMEICQHWRSMGTMDVESDTLAAIIEGTATPRELTPEVAEAITQLWAKEGFKEAWSHRSEFQVQDTWNEFADQVSNYPEWGGPDWLPSIGDVMRGRIRTSGVVDELYKIRHVVFRMIDVGGQRNERRKWIHCFEGVTAVIFVAAISEYNQVLFEDDTQNRLVEAISLFKEMSTSSWFRKTAMILFLNKRDLFQDKLVRKGVPLNVSGLFPDAPGGDKVAVGYEEGLQWVTQKFVEVHPPKKDLFTHVTCATDTQNISTVFNACAEIILKQNLENNGFLNQR